MHIASYLMYNANEREKENGSVRGKVGIRVSRESRREGEGGRGRATRHTFPCPNVFLTLATFPLKAKSKLFIETHLEMPCSAIN